jgi:GNAT superfamily N-acetyltransferase
MPGVQAQVTPEAADLNLVTHMTWVQSRLPGGHVELGDELVLSDSGLPSDTFNFVTRARLDAGAEAAIRRVTGYFGSAGRPFSWWLGPADRPGDLGRALLDAGFSAAESELAMAADLGSLAAGDPAPGGLRIERATTAAQIRDFARVCAANWTPPDAEVLRFYRIAAPLLRRRGCPIRLYVGYLGAEAVATAELTVSEGAVGLYNIATLEAHRRKGFGTALTLRPLLDAREEGHALAVLQASEQGQGVYAGLGFRETGRYTEYQLPRVRH